MIFQWIDFINKLKIKKDKESSLLIVDLRKEMNSREVQVFEACF